jgi:hypothetical protein
MRPLGQLFVWLLLVGALIAFVVRTLLWLLGIAAVIAAVLGVIWLIYRGSNNLIGWRAKRSAHRYTADMAMTRARLRDQTELIARCDEQHQQVTAGDEHGVYGIGYPERQKYEEACRMPEREAQRAEFDAEAAARRER